MRARVLTWKRPLCLEKSLHSFFGKRKFQLKVFVWQTLVAPVKKAHRWERVDYWWVLHWKRLCVRLCISGIQRRRISGRPFHRAQHSQPAGCSPCRSRSPTSTNWNYIAQFTELSHLVNIIIFTCMCARACLSLFSPDDTQSHFQQLQGFFSLCPCVHSAPCHWGSLFCQYECGVWKHQTADEGEGIFVCASRNPGLLLKFRQYKIWPREWVWRWSFSFCLLFCQRLLFFFYISIHFAMPADWHKAQLIAQCAWVFSVSLPISPAFFDLISF